MDYDWKTNIIYSLFPVQGPRDKFGIEGGDPGKNNKNLFCLNLFNFYLFRIL
jgi:hypothetical protein